MINVKTATTADLLTYFNAHHLPEKRIKKFADRATAERRVSALIKSERDSSVSGFEAHGQIHCPSCGIHLSNGVSQHGDDVNGKPLRHDTHMFECMGCGGGFGDLIKRAAASTTRSAGIAASWKKPEVAAARAERTGTIEVRQGDKLIGSYRSVAHAFSSLGMSLKGHVPFRMMLKLEGQLTYDCYSFAIAK